MKDRKTKEVSSSRKQKKHEKMMYATIFRFLALYCTFNTYKSDDKTEAYVISSNICDTQTSDDYVQISVFLFLLISVELHPHLVYCFVRGRKKTQRHLADKNTPGISILCNWVDFDVKLNKRSWGRRTNNCLDKHDLW